MRGCWRVKVKKRKAKGKAKGIFEVQAEGEREGDEAGCRVRRSVYERSLVFL